MEWLEPWWPTAGQGREFHETFRRELELELSPGHELYGVPVRLIGRHAASDDALFELLDGSGRVAAVHLTWANRPERVPWPETAIYGSAMLDPSALRGEWTKRILRSEGGGPTCTVRSISTDSRSISC